VKGQIKQRLEQAKLQQFQEELRAKAKTDYKFALCPPCRGPAAFFMAATGPNSPAKRPHFGGCPHRGLSTMDSSGGLICTRKAATSYRQGAQECPRPSIPT
jgi:hypothetical protein